MEVSYTEFYPTWTNNVANRAKHYIRLLQNHVSHCIAFHETQ